MKRKKKPADGFKGLPGWMASYADMFTVLMAFFVLLFAMSVIEEELFQQFIISFNPARIDDFIDIGAGGDMIIDIGQGLFPMEPPPPAIDANEEETAGDDEDADDLDAIGADGGIDLMGDVIGDMMNTFRTYMAYHEWGEGLEPEILAGEDFIQITLPGGEDGMLFDSGQAILLPGAQYVLNQLAPLLEDFALQGHGIIVEGHTDWIPMSPGSIFPSNWELSGARASAVVRYLVNNWDIPTTTIAAIGRAEYFPIATNETAEGRALNRRVEIKVFSQEATGGAVGAWWTIPRD